MVMGERIQRLLDVREMSQSELARRLGLRQSTINMLIKGGSQGSKHLHRIARELGTTPAYLSGETDDPESELPGMGVLVLDSETRELLRLLDRMGPGDKRALVQVARSMAKIPAVSSKVHDSNRGLREAPCRQKGE